MAAIPLSDHPERVRQALVGGRMLDVENVWRHGDRVIFKFRGVNSISEAEALAGADVCIPKNARADLPEGEFYQTDLVGCTVLERDGTLVGTVEAWQEYGGPPLLQVNARGREVLIPFAKSICVEIDPKEKRIVVDLPEGLKNLNAE